MDTTHTSTLGDRGRLVVPAALREHQRWEQGTPLVFVETPRGVVVATREQLTSIIRDQLAGTSLAEELLTERRAGAMGEDAT